MIKPKYSVPITLILGIFVVLGYVVYGSEGNVEICREFLSSYGWEVSKSPTDKAEITIPDEFDIIYTNYNKMQKTANLDLTPYCGKAGVRYTFVVNNYPLDVGEQVFANVIVIDNKAVAGDIMTVSLNGFMHSLAENHP